MTPEDRAQIKAALPVHISFERFERNLSNALMNEPRLLDCNPREVFREVAKIAAIGLLIDAQLGEAYLISSSKGPQARVGYRGLIKLARQSGDVALIYAHEVYSNDEIDCLLGDEKKLTHRPNLFGDRGEIVGYYAVIKFKDGDTDFEPMTPAQINIIRDKSDGYKAFKAGKIKDTPWASSYDEMAKKTCIRRLMKRSPQSPELATALSLEDRAEFTDLPSSRAGRIAPPPPPIASIEHEPTKGDDPQLGWQDVEDVATETTAPPETESNKDTQRRAPPPPTTKPPVPEIDWTKVLADHKDAIDAAKDADALDVAFSDIITPHDKIMPSWVYEAASKQDDIRRGELEIAGS
jgi:recombination protein RecT